MWGVYLGYNNIMLGRGYTGIKKDYVCMWGVLSFYLELLQQIQLQLWSEHTSWSCALMLAPNILSN